MIEQVRREFHEQEETIKEKQREIKELQEKCRIYKELEEKHRAKTHEAVEENQKVMFPCFVLNKSKEGELHGWKGEGGECRRIVMKWEKEKNDWGHFDIDMLVEYNRALGKIDSS